MTAPSDTQAAPDRLTIGLLGTQDREKGGVYQYSLSVVDALATATSRRDEIVLFGSSAYPGLDALAAHGLRLAPPLPAEPPPSAVRRYRAAAARRLQPIVDPAVELAARGGWITRPRQRPDIRRHLREADIDLMVYSVPSEIAFEAGVPYVMAIHDLQHRLNPDREEIATGRVWVDLEYRYRYGARNALLLLADSETGKEDILRFYGDQGVTEDRVVVVPFVPPPYLAGASEPDEQVAARYDLPPRYFFYPASTWPSKNHVALVRAFAALARRVDDPPELVLCGSTRGPLRKRTLAEALHAAEAGGVAHLVRHIGLVPDEHMATLYRRATALTMPTLLGPTNIPVVEAWSLGCPVLTSDARGIREHAGDAAVLVDPRDPDRIADGLEQLATDEPLRARLIERSRERIASYGFADFQRELLEAIDLARSRLTSSPR